MRGDCTFSSTLGAFTRLRVVQSLALATAAWLVLLDVGCTAPGDEWARVVEKLPEYGIKPIDVKFSSTQTINGAGQVSGTSTPPSGSASGSVADVSSTTVSFTTVPIKDPPVAVKFGIESVSPSADAGVLLVVNGNPVSMVNDPASAQSLATAYRGNWHVFKPAAPVTVGVPAGKRDRVYLELSRSDTLPMPPAGTPLPAKGTTRVAVQFETGQWIVVPADDPIQSDNVVISPALPSPLRVRQGTPTVVPEVLVKNASPNPLNVALTAQFTQNQTVRASANLGAVALGRYDLKALSKVSLPTQGLPPGFYTLLIAGMSGTVREGSTQIVVEVTR